MTDPLPTDKDAFQPLGDRAVEERFVVQMNAIANAMDDFLNPDGQKVGFILMVFPFGNPEPGHQINYMSNADRNDVIATLREQLAYFEGRNLPGGKA
jgi:hypothetical protein